MLNSQSIKQNVDALQDVCFYAIDGQPLLINNHINSICGFISHLAAVRGSYYENKKENYNDNTRPYAFCRCGVPRFCG